MTTIAIPDSVAEILRKATRPTQLVDEDGQLVGSFSPIPAVDVELTDEELAEIKQRRHSPGPWLTTDELKGRIRFREQR
jgi:hypothetical protein